MTHARMHTITGSLTFLVILLALTNWSVAPESANSWIAALITMPVIWGVAAVMMRFQTFQKISAIERKYFVSAVILAALLLAFSLGAKLIGHTTNVEPSLIERARGVSLGFVLLYLGNLMPKVIGPSLKNNCSIASANAVRRFAGFTFVIASLGYIGAWIFAPLARADNIATGIVAGGVLLVVLRILIAIKGVSR